VSRRSVIPAEITRQLLIESGHRCAVCGTPSPLERAHIVPLTAEGDNTADNLICLCPNCHMRADQENWPSSVLRKYKETPWVARKVQDESSKTVATQRVMLSLEMSSEDFSKDQERMRNAIAAFLGISPEEVRIVSIEAG
jgi:type I restriction enzyme, R subunit